MKKGWLLTLIAVAAFASPAAAASLPSTVSGAPSLSLAQMPAGIQAAIGLLFALFVVLAVFPLFLHKEDLPVENDDETQERVDDGKRW